MFPSAVVEVWGGCIVGGEDKNRGPPGRRDSRSRSASAQACHSRSLSAVCWSPRGAEITATLLSPESLSESEFCGEIHRCVASTRAGTWIPFRGLVRRGGGAG